MRYRLGTASVFALFLTLSAGCGSGTGTVSGTVKVGGTPLKRGLITFLSAKGACNAAIINGKYDTAPEEIPTGLTKAIVISTQGEPGEGPATPQGDDRTAPPKPARKAAEAIPVPEKYHSADTSGLQLTVKRGPNTFDLDLTP